MKKTGRFPAAIHGAGIACLAVFTLALALSGCGGREKITALSQLEGKEFAVPTGTMADQLVLSKFPKAKFVYFNTVLRLPTTSQSSATSPRRTTASRCSTRCSRSTITALRCSTRVRN